MNPFFIGISGESGVGKTTIAEIISLFFSNLDLIIISTDDLHKWERTNIAWNNITHLNAEANNLELGDIHLEDISNGKSIYRSVYNHNTGWFNPPLKIDPKSIIIIEGLHAFYTDISKKLIDLKIFVDTDEDLRTHWKIIRDTEERNYTYHMVLDAIKNRKSDSNKTRDAQINDADVIINIFSEQKIKCIGDRNEKINLIFTFTYNKPVAQDMFIFINNYIVEMNKFINISEVIGNNIELCQNNGGNISLKISDKYMIIKPSGSNLKDAYRTNCRSIINYEKINLKLNQVILNDDILDEILISSVTNTKYKKPSMETAFHVILNKHVIHVHPIYITLLLCLENSKKIIAELFANLSYNYINYATPGYNLYKEINMADKAKSIYFLENHGLILTGDDLSEISYLLQEINDVAKLYIEQRCDFKIFDSHLCQTIIEKKYLFPDAVIFAEKQEILAAHNFMQLYGGKIGNLRYLTHNDVDCLFNLSAEIYRKNENYNTNGRNW